MRASRLRRRVSREEILVLRAAELVVGVDSETWVELLMSVLGTGVGFSEDDGDFFSRPSKQPRIFEMNEGIFLTVGVRVLFLGSEWV
jgi:hypothetical protein